MRSSSPSRPTTGGARAAHGQPGDPEGLHPGDQVDITWTTATIVSVD
jgi:hypothetical protein